MAKAVGIDLGTTNSVIATTENGHPTVIPNSEGSRTTPSVVAFTEEGERLVGQLARRQAILNPKGTIYSAKRFIGRRYDEVASEIHAVSFDVVPGPDGAVRFNVRGKLYAPEEISALVLRKLADDAGKFLGERVTEAVITVPAYFNDAQRQATKDAGKIAGLEVLRIINEPTAAALAYGLDKGANETVLIFDLGGGTFDVSLLSIGEGVVEVLSTAGDGHLGGDDFDRRIVDYLADEFQHDTGIDLRQDPQALQRLFEAAEKAKVELSSVTQTTVNLPFVTADASGPKHLNTTLRRSTFEQITSDLIERTKGPVQTAMSDAKVTANDIDEVILVGGSTRIPAVADNRVLARFRLENIRPAPRGVPQVEVTFDIDANGILNVSARDKDTGVEQTVTISETTNLDQSEIERMIREAEEHRSEDERLREMIDARNTLDSIAYQVEKRIQELGDAAPPHEKARAEMLVGDARQAIKEEAPLERLRSLTAELQQVYYGLSAAAGGGPGPGAPGGPGGPAGPEAGGGPAAGGAAGGDEDVIDAEFTTDE
jgi:molecular chaperone DnaK (HSP70)